MATDDQSAAPAVEKAAPVVPPLKAIAPADPTDPAFPLGRLLDRIEGEQITGLGHPLIAGALADEPADAELTRTQVQAKADAFLAHEVQMEG